MKEKLYTTISGTGTLSGGLPEISGELDFKKREEIRKAQLAQRAIERYERACYYPDFKSMSTSELLVKRAEYIKLNGFVEWESSGPVDCSKEILAITAELLTRKHTDATH